jgi:hypothetical protein
LLHTSKYYASKPDFHSKPKPASPQGYSSRITAKTKSKLSKSTSISTSKSSNNGKNHSSPISCIPSDINIKDENNNKDWLSKARNSVQRVIYNDNANASKELFENVDQM